MGEKNIFNNRIKIGKTAEVILQEVAKTGILMVGGVVKASITTALFNQMSYKTRKELSDHIDELIWSLVDKRVLGYSKKEDKFYLESRGQWEAAQRGYLDNRKLQTKNFWDGKWRVVVFDVAETQKNMRDRLRRAFIRYGFYQLQKSVWVYPYSCDHFVQSLKEDLGLQIEVLYMVVESIENQLELERELDLR